MTRRVRRIFFLVSAALLAAVFWSGYSKLPPVGALTGAYGDVVNAITVPERHITDAVTAVNFDIRGFDTLGEEFILFTSVMGAVLLMRRQADEHLGDHEDRAKDRVVPDSSDAVRVTALLLVTPTVLFGLYIVTHGQVSPGGGFQGGVILSTAPLLLYLSSTFGRFRQAAPQRLIAISEAIGAAAYILIGGACVGWGDRFCKTCCH